MSFHTHGILTTDETKTILAHIMTASNPTRPYHPSDIHPPLLLTTLQTLNTRLLPLDYEIRPTKSQSQPPTTYYALVNNASDALTQLATTLSVPEMGFLRRLLDCMFETNCTQVREVMAVKGTMAVNLARPGRGGRDGRQSGVHGMGEGEEEGGVAPDPGISLHEAEALLAKLVDNSFLEKSPRGYYSLAPRSLLELRSYLKETYNDDGDDDEEEGGGGGGVIRIRDCHGCKEIVTVGIRCNNRVCGVRWHDGCANAWYRGSKGGRERRCPLCKTVCGGNVFVGERADRVDGGGGGGGKGRGSSNGKGGGGYEEEEEEEMDDEE
ncbi:hypothetical protein GMOD_00010240 [Pyrenophora seminiperda CCB06]|uniref:Non-structural maintenance of chromosomes element 1 homolog n=1 Tax=Pyrenophora seminiperda CCB06 TaxID=1302712 RepID=A0A3M7MD21_9PLEO|nr:hypothetical protein GMOD_00010240 [Pyrenophora seminiperda CCB06]